MTEITELSGIADSKADDLVEAGFETVEDIAAASPGDIQAVDGFGDVRAQKIHDQAIDMISVESDEDDSSEESDATEDGGSEESTESSDEAPADADDDEDTVYEVPIDVNTVQRNHLIAALARRELEERQRKDTERVDACHDLMEQVREGKSEITCDETQVHVLYSAITGLMNDYHGTRGIVEVSREVRALQEEISEFRDNNLF